MSDGARERINYIDPTTFKDEGYLQESNRLFFHPFGLALEIWPGGWDDEWVEKKLVEAGLPHDADTVRVVSAFLDATQLNQPHIGCVWDYRDDPEGMYFGHDEDEQVAAAVSAARVQRADNIQRILDERERARVEALGYVIQPVSEL